MGRNRRSTQDATGLVYFTIQLPSKKALDDIIFNLNDAGYTIKEVSEGFFLKDPSGIGILLSNKD